MDKPAAPVTPDERLGLFPFIRYRSSGPLGWTGVRVEDIPDLPAGEVEQPALSHVLLILMRGTTPRRAFVQCDDARYEADGRPDTTTVIPAGVESRYRWANTVACTHVQLAPALVSKVAAEACGLDPARLSFRPTIYDPHPPLVGVMSALRDELLTGGAGGRLAAESLANVLAVHLIRYLASGPDVRGLTGVLARHAVRAVEEFVTDNLDADLSLADLAAVAHLSEFHFARLFKATTGQTPHQFVIEKRVEKAKELIRERRLALVQIAAEVGFASQSHLHRHFKRLVGCTPGEFGN